MATFDTTTSNSAAVTQQDEDAILAERRLLSPKIPPGAVVLSESTPIAYYLDDVLNGTPPSRTLSPVALRALARVSLGVTRALCCGVFRRR